MDKEVLDLGNLSTAYVEAMLERFRADPGSVSSDWHDYFAAQFRKDGQRPTSPAPAGSDGAKLSNRKASPQNEAPAARRLQTEEELSTPVSDLRDAAQLQDRVDQLIRAYRVRGHIIAQVDPLGLHRPTPPELSVSFHGLTVADLDRTCSTRTVRGPEFQTLRNIIERMQNTYCRSIGAQFMHIDDLQVRDWLQQRMEDTENRIKLSRSEQLRILKRLTDASIFEEFVRKKYVGAKTFSLEGAESLIPLLDLAIETAGAHSIDEIVIGMAHRGRLNVLANILEKRPLEMFREFEGRDPIAIEGGGDVKYHLGHSSDWTTVAGRKIHLSLCFNPSHLEFVGPVAVGRMRAKQDRMGNLRRDRGMVLLIHGDASFAGEGVVQEMLNMSQLPGYHVGGTLHVVVNNQIGFTTGPNEARSCMYATDVAKMLQIPIFHVNGESPEAVAQVVRLAMEFRRTFHRNVVIDLYCYRRWGHNEGDEPSFTQPLLYRAVRKRQSVRDGYLEHLLELDEVTREEADEMATERRAHLQQEFDLARKKDPPKRPNRKASLAGVWDGYSGGLEPVDDVETAVDRERLQSLLVGLTSVPEEFHVHPKLQKLLDERRAVGTGEESADFPTAEALAFATLSTEFHRIRLTGQDSERGTFSHRHAVLHDTETGQRYMPLEHLSPHQAPVEIYNSPLCEAGVLGFDYGYSLDYPEALVCWEAQFGDFWNAAQVIVDQFIASAEEKWRRLSGITLLLPHGFEGQGPEHSSARLERFLMLAARDNLQVAEPTTPAQYFHLLRRQAKRRWRKPLIVLTPKSLLRHKAAVSPIEEFSFGQFQRILPDEGVEAGPGIRRILVCSGKIYYDLLERRERDHHDDVALIRLEQLYPFPDQLLRETLADYADETPVYWVQEEPENMGAWFFLKVRFCHRLVDRFPFDGISRASSASPATGAASRHRIEQEEIISRAFAPE